MAYFDVQFFSKTLKKNTEINVFIPSISADDYLFNDNHLDYYNKQKFQTLYLLHGSYGDFSDWMLFTSVYRYAQENCLAVVMPSGENSSYINMKHGEAYLDFISEELRTYCATIFPLSSKREDNFIAGLSMGGYGAYRCAFNHPEYYSACASLSGGLTKENPEDRKEAHARKMPLNYRNAVMGENGSLLKSSDDLYILLDQLLKDRVNLPMLYHTIGQDDFLKEKSEEFINYAKDKGVNIEYHIHAGAHNWDYWDSHIKDVIDWLPLRHNKV